MNPATFSRSSLDIDYNSRHVHVLPAIAALLIAAAGWFYMFYSQAAHRLEGIEEQDTNARRKRLRRAGGLIMFLLGATVYVFFDRLEQTYPSAAVLLFLLAMMLVLMLSMLVLGLIDLRLTAKLRRKQKNDSLPQ